MAIVAITDTESLSRGVHAWAWDTLTNGDSGGPLTDKDGAVAFADKTIQIKGTWGAGGTAVIEGSNDGVAYFTLNDPQGVALSFDADALASILENPRYLRPRVTAGDGTTDLDVKIIGRAIMQLR